MALTYSDIQSEVKRRATRDNADAQYTTAAKNAINASLFRLSQEALWRPLRRRSSFDTISSYTTGSGGGTFTNDSKNVTVTSATWLTDDIQPGRRITLQGSSKTFTIKTITGETTLTLDQVYDGTTISGTGTYKILGQEEYTLPIQASHKVFLWHEDWGYPYLMSFVTDMDFVGSGVDNTEQGTPTHYRMWANTSVDKQVKNSSVITVVSSDSGDTSQTVTVYGTVSGLPDSETISLNGTSSAAGSKSFTYVERIVKNASTTGRITVTADSGNTTVVVLPLGDTTAGIYYHKVQLHPLPDLVLPIQVYSYKIPYRLINDDDVHELGQDFDEALILLATAKLKKEQNQGEGAEFMKDYRDELKVLRRTNVDKIDWFPKLMRPTQSGFSDRVHPHLRARQAGSKFGVRVI
jgi:hypothetical protein